jgi:hypothetical protein
VDELNQLLGRLRWRLGFERLLQFGVRGTLASGVTLGGLSVAIWLTGNQHTPLWLAAGPLLAALALAGVRWPTRRHAALAADQRLALQNRLATAIELTEGHQRSRFEALQIRDAVRHAQIAPRAWLALDDRARNEALLAAGVIVLALVSLLLSSLLPRPAAPVGRTDVVDAFGPSEVDQRALPIDTSEQALAKPQASQSTQTAPGLANRVQQEQAERSALDALSQALGSVSAGQQAADAIQQGNFGAARDQLQSLGDQADQLSDAAKQQLARALQEASAATAATDKQLADKERQAAQALSRSSYSEQRQALRGLADQVERSGARSVPADQLQRDVGRLQQQTGGAPQGPGAGQAPGATGKGAPASADQRATSGAGVGSGVDPNVLGDPSRLDTAGQQVQVPTKLNGGPGVRPPNGTEDVGGADPSLANRSVSELSQAQQTGQVAPEQNLVPGEQRPVIRGYFR